MVPIKVEAQAAEAVRVHLRVRRAAAKAGHHPVAAEADLARQDSVEQILAQVEQTKQFKLPAFLQTLLRFPAREQQQRPESFRLAEPRIRVRIRMAARELTDLATAHLSALLA